MANANVIELLHDGVLRKTPSSVKFLFEEDLEIWIPSSVIQYYNDKTVIVPEWFAENKELEVYAV